ncbi:MAG TPA: hypothetical protein VF933_23745 [Streptosporangiaceae bacterium]
MATKATGGGLDFLVPFIGMKLRVGTKLTKKDTHTIDITLEPPEDRDTRQVRGGEVEEVLVNAIATIRNAVTKAAEGDDPWILSASTIDISFAITQTGSISLGADGSWLTSSLTPCVSDWRLAFRKGDRPAASQNQILGARHEGVNPVWVSSSDLAPLVVMNLGSSVPAELKAG